jgi:hypothetical protein
MLRNNHGDKTYEKSISLASAPCSNSAVAISTRLFCAARCKAVQPYLTLRQYRTLSLAHMHVLASAITRFIILRVRRQKSTLALHWHELWNASGMLLGYSQSFDVDVSAGPEKRAHAGDVVTPHGVVQVVGCSSRARSRACEHAGANGLVLLLGESRCEGGDDDEEEEEEEEEDLEGEGSGLMRGEEHREQGAATSHEGAKVVSDCQEVERKGRGGGDCNICTTVDVPVLWTDVSK